MLRRLISSLADIVYPKTCMVCKDKLGPSAIENLICAQCWSKIKKNNPPFCHCCGRQLTKAGFSKNICPACIKKKLHFDRAFSPCVYEGVTKELIHKLKYNNKDRLGIPLSKLMIDFINEYNLPIEDLDVIIPVPLHATRLREREFNQAQILCEKLAAAFKKDTACRALKRNRYTLTQTELSPQERLRNVSGSFQVTTPDAVRGKNVLLVDDVLTTAATSSEAALALKQAGANIVFVLTLAN